MNPRVLNTVLCELWANAMADITGLSKSIVSVLCPRHLSGGAMSRWRDLPCGKKCHEWSHLTVTS